MTSSSGSDTQNLGQNESEQEYATPEESEYATSEESEAVSLDDSNASTPVHKRTFAEYPPPSSALVTIPKRKPCQPPKRPPTKAELDKAADLNKQAEASTGPLTRSR